MKANMSFQIIQPTKCRRRRVREQVFVYRQQHGKQEHECVQKQRNKDCAFLPKAIERGRLIIYDVTRKTVCARVGTEGKKRMDHMQIPAR